MASGQNRLLDCLRTPALVDLDRRALLVVAVTSLAMSLLLFAMPMYSLQIYDRVFVSRSTDTLLLLSLVVLPAVTAYALLDIVRSRLLLRIGNAHVLRLAPLLFDSAVADSAKISVPDDQFVRQIGIVRGFIVGPQGLVTLFDAPLVPLFLALVYLMHVGLGHAMLFGMVVLIILASITEHFSGWCIRAAGEAGADAHGRVVSIMHNAEAIEAMGMRRAMRDYWMIAQNASLADASLAGDRSSGIGALAKWTRMLLSVSLTCLGAWYVIQNEITLGTMVAASILSARGLAPLETLIGAWRGLTAARASIEWINQKLAEGLRLESATKLPDPSGCLSVERLVYVPPGTEQPTLKSVSFAVQAGKWLAVVGPSAAGKSTLAKVMVGVWRPYSGAVRLDGADTFTWQREDFGRHCGYLPQDVELFSGSIRENIARFRHADDATDLDVIAAAKLAGVHDLILRLPMGYETPIGVGGAALSAGQRQRIGLARALLGRPKLVVLDEPNSNLDAEGEIALLEALRTVRRGGATIVMIGHRPSLLMDADLIAVLVDGQLQQFGSRDEILAKILPSSHELVSAKDSHGG